MIVHAEDFKSMGTEGDSIILYLEPNKLIFQSEGEKLQAMSYLDHDELAKYIEGDEVPCDCPGNDRLCRKCNGKGELTCHVTYR